MCNNRICYLIQNFAGLEHFMEVLYIILDFSVSVVASLAKHLNVQQRKPVPECCRTTSIVPVSTGSRLSFFETCCKVSRLSN
jgi:hypothetical protein